MAREIYSMVRESVINAARHGGARNVEVAVGQRGRGVVVRVSDDGHGFPYSGSFDDRELRAQGLGPRTLRERTAVLGGTLSLVSSERGARVEMTMPGGAGG